MAQVRMSGIRKSYDNHQMVIQGVDLTVRDGEFMVFVGPSGCGKSTMLRMIAGLEEITDGDLYVGNEIANDLTPVQRGVSMVFQSYALYPHMTVEENMGFGLKMAGVKKAEVKKLVGQAAEMLQLNALLERKPKALSGGQRQRVAIGRAIVRKPKVFLFDEPLSNLDAGLRVQMRIELAKLHQELGTTMIYVTHDQVEAMTLGDRIAVFNKGVIEQVGTPLSLYERPGNLFVAGFLGSPTMNILPAKVVSTNATDLVLGVEGAGSLRLPASSAIGLKPGASVSLGLRPETLAFTADGAGLRGRVDVVEHLGDNVIAYVRVGSLPDLVAVKLQVGQDALPRAGAQIGLVAGLQGVHLFDTAGSAIARANG